MLLNFVLTADVSKENTWISASREYLEKHPITVNPNGMYFCGPWQLDPRNQTAAIDIDRARLDVRFARVGGEFRITGAKITEAHGLWHK